MPHTNSNIKALLEGNATNMYLNKPQVKSRYKMVIQDLSTKSFQKLFVYLANCTLTWHALNVIFTLDVSKKLSKNKFPGFYSLFVNILQFALAVSRWA